MIVTVFLLLMGFFASIASFFLKKSTSDGLRIRNLLLNPYLYVGGGLYVLSALLNIYLLKQLPYSLVVPLGSLTYIWTLIFAHQFLNENITKQKVTGVLLILIGIGIIVYT